MVRVSENARIVSGDFTHQHLRTYCHIPRTRQGPWSIFLDLLSLELFFTDDVFT